MIKLDLGQKEVPVKVNSVLFISDSNPNLLCVATAEDLGIAPSALNSIMPKKSEIVCEMETFLKRSKETKAGKYRVIGRALLEWFRHKHFQKSII